MKYDQIMRMVDDVVGARPEGVVDFLEATAQAAYNTADHIQQNYGTKDPAFKAWKKIGDRLQRERMKVEKLLPF